MQYYVYIWTNTVNGKQYVGKGKGRRARQHIAIARSGAGYLLAQAIRKYGEAPFRLTYLFEGLSAKEASSLEVLTIANRQSKSPSGYNLTDGGEGTPGLFASEETRRRQSDAHKGHKHTPEHIEKTRKANSGRTRSAECRARMSEAQQKRSPETRAKLSAALTGQKFPPERLEKMRQAASGKSPSVETRAKLSAALKGRPKSSEMRAKLAASRRGTRLMDGQWVADPGEESSDET